jgi:hypothetical protein
VVAHLCPGQSSYWLEVLIVRRGGLVHESVPVGDMGKPLETRAGDGGIDYPVEAERGERQNNRSAPCHPAGQPQ